MARAQTATRRQTLHSLFESILGSTNVYFQPPASILMHYPCIRYTLSDYDTVYANNVAYRYLAGYDVIVIDRNPDSEIPEKILNNFKWCRFDRKYVSDNLHHFVFRIYY